MPKNSHTLSERVRASYSRFTRLPYKDIDRVLLTRLWASWRVVVMPICHQIGPAAGIRGYFCIM